MENLTEGERGAAKGMTEDELEDMLASFDFMDYDGDGHPFLRSLSRPLYVPLWSRRM